MRINKAVLVIAAVVAVLIMGIGGFVAYGILFPPVWTEQLPYENSTGQHQAITVYRNATDVSYDNLTRFLESNDIESLVYADPVYRPVEYAALLHDMAEVGGINCTLIASGMADGDSMPKNVVNAFYTTDRGMVYVDTTAMNVSQDDYTVPFDSILLLREYWTTPTPWKNYDRQYLNVTTYRDAKPVSYDDLIAFLDSDVTEEKSYVIPAYTCVDFSADLYNNAESKGIKCGFVSVYFTEDTDGHAFNVFETTDKGTVYIDCTGINDTRKEEGWFATDNIVYIQKGSQLGELPDNQTNGDLSYAFYLDRMEKINAFMAKVDQYLKDVDTFSADNRALKADMDSYNAKMYEHNNAVYAFNAENEKKSQEYSPDDYLRWYNENSAKIPPAPGGGSELNQRKATLEAQYNSLENRRLELLNSEESNWITFNPVGTVANVTVYWP